MTLSSRRSFVVASVGGAGLVGRANGAARRQPTVAMEHFAPFDVTVVTIAKAGQVKQGDTLIAMSSPELEKRAARLQSLAHGTAVLRRPLDDGHAQAYVDALKVGSGVGGAMATEGQEVLRSFRRAWNRDAYIPGANALVAYGSVQAASADLKVKSAQLALNDARDLLALFESYIKTEEEIVARLREALSVSSPVAGRFQPRTQVGRYVPQGTVLFALHPKEE